MTMHARTCALKKCSLVSRARTTVRIWSGHGRVVAEELGQRFDHVGLGRRVDLAVNEEAVEVRGT